MKLFVLVILCTWSGFVFGDPAIAESIQNPAWHDKHEYFCERAANNNSDMSILFLGDSMTEYWGSYGINVWNATYAPLNAFRFGIKGDRSENLLWRLENGEVKGISPKVVILMIGSNNAAYDTGVAIANGIKANVDYLRTNLPKTKVLLLGLLPALNALGFELLSNINEKVEALGLDNGDTVRYLNMFSHFYKTWGVPDPDLYASDYTHLGRKGYQLWADLMNPLFEEMLAS